MTFVLSITVIQPIAKSKTNYLQTFTMTLVLSTSHTAYDKEENELSGDIHRGINTFILQTQDS